jgi:signal transduction histidine kinase/AraC-like DNA-binding protein/sugar lactone lactonase YvrE
MYFGHRNYIILLIFIQLAVYHSVISQISGSFYEQKKFGGDLVYELIEDILIDGDGFVWIGTSTGLYCFDGYNYKRIQQDSKKQDFIPLYYVIDLYEDTQGNIWILTINDGISVYNKKDNSFYNYTYQEDNNSLLSNKLSRQFNIITESITDNKIWVISNSGLNQIDHQLRTVKQYPMEIEGHLLYDDNQEVIWVAGNQLKWFDPKSSKPQLKEIAQLLKSEQIKAMLKDPLGNLWLGSEAGIYIYVPEKDKVITLHELFQGKKEYKSADYKWESQNISSLYLDYQNRIWVGAGTAVYVVNPLTGSCFQLKQKNPEYDLPDQELQMVEGIYGNQRGTVIITYEYRGMTKINVKVEPFEPMVQFFYGKNIRSIAKDSKQNLWIGTGNDGLYKLNNGSLTDFQHYKHDSHNPKSLNSNYITAIHFDPYKRLWLGTFKNGFCYTDYPNVDNLSFVRSLLERNIEIHEFTEGPSGNLWISTEAGFYIYDRHLDTLIHYGDLDKQVKAVKNINIQSVVFNQPNELWMATWNKGICKLIVDNSFNSENNSGKDSLFIYDKIKDVNKVRLDSRFISIIKDKEHNLWLASFSDGLVKMEIKQNNLNFIKYDRSSGAPANTINAVVQDKKGNIWVSSSSGLGKLQTETGLFNNYYEPDGIHDNTFIWDSYFQDTDGKIYFGGLNGLTAFHPDSIESVNIPLQAYISRLTINHKDVNVGDTVNNRVILSQNIRFAKKITLTHQEPVFNLEFAALNIEDPSEVSFAYQLEGFDEDWIYTNSNNRVATYTNLERGLYRFKLKASTSFGVWNEDPVVLEIEILPVWWKTYWAYSIYIIIFLILLYLFQLELQKRVALVHQIEMEHFQHEKENELNKDKFKFFTNLSHELRTPLTLILGPVERMIESNEGNSRVHQNLLLIRKQTEKLLNLTNQFLNFRKFEKDNLILKAAEGNLIIFLQEIALAFRQHAILKSINFQYQPGIDSLKLYYDRDKLEIIISNLLSNAFKFTPPQGHVHLKVTEKNIDEIKRIIKSSEAEKSSHFGKIINSKYFVEMEVSDTGCGIDKTKIQNIFQHYFQSGSIDKISSYGIGLEIVKNYVELHSGCIYVTSKEGFGTSFYIWLPKGNTHLKNDEIISDFIPSDDSRHYNIPSDIFAETNLEYNVIPNQTDTLPVMLIVDDNPDIVAFLKDNFRNHFQIKTATDGKDGLSKAFDLLPDVIISDIMMPGIDGLEFCATIKSNIRTSHIPVVLLTARTSSIFQAEGLETGADDYITKPFNVKILNIRIRNLIESRRKLRARYSQDIFLKPKEIANNKPDEIFLNETIRIIEKYLDDPDFKIEILTTELGMSHSVLYKKIMALTDLSIVEFIRSIRLKKASYLLKEQQSPISEISHLVGFSDPKYFSKSFKEFYGKTPSEFRRSGLNYRE